MVAPGVAGVAIDGAEDALRMEFFHESAGAVVDGLAGEGAVVGVHDAVDEAEAHPVGDEFGLGGDDALEEGEVLGWASRRLRGSGG